MSGLTEFLIARIAEDEEAMGRIAGRQWYACDDGHVQEPEVDERDQWLGIESEARLPNHHNSWALVLDPARVLAECEVKKALVIKLASAHGASEVWVTKGRDEILSITDEALRLLALPYADHADYRQEWAVQ